MTQDFIYLNIMFIDDYIIEKKFKKYNNQNN